MTLKRTIPIFLIFALSIASGIFYNTYLTEYPPIFGDSYALTRYTGSIITVLSFFLFRIVLHHASQRAFIKHRTSPTAFMIYMCIAALVIYVIKHAYPDIGYLSVLVILYIFPFALRVIPQFERKHASLCSAATLVLLIASCSFISNIKTAFFSAATFIITELITIKMMNPKRKKQWYVHAGVLAILTVICFCIVILLESDTFASRIAGFLNPASVPEYGILSERLNSCRLISFTPDKSFVTDMNSMDVCPYAHIMTCFGILPTIIFIALQALAAVLIFRNSTVFEDSTRKLLGTASAVMIALHLSLSVLSSFRIIPIIEYGAPLLTISHIGTSLVPILLYFTLEFSEYLNAKKRKNLPEKE